MDKESQSIFKSDKKTLLWLMKRSKQQIPAIVWLTCLQIMVASTTVVYAFASRHILNGAQNYAKTADALVKSQLRHDMILWACVLVGTIFVQLLLQLLGRGSEERIFTRLRMIYQKDLYEKILRKNYQAITRHHSGELLNYIFSDTNLITSGIVSLVPSVVGLVARLVFASVALLYLKPFFAAVFFTGGLLVFFVSRLFRAKMKSLHKKVQEADGKVRAFMQETVGNILMVKAFSAEDKMSREADRLQEEFYKASMRRKTMTILANSGLGFVFRAGTLFVMIWGAFSICTGAMMYGDLTAIMQLIGQVQAPFAGLSGMLPTYFAILASAERIMEIEAIADEEEFNDAMLDTKEVYNRLQSIDFRNLTFAYDRDKIFDHTDYTIDKGDFVAMLGISGIGKSTLFKLLLGVITDYDGEIDLNLGDEKIKVDRNARNLFAYVPQGNMLLSGTLRENVTFVNENATDEEIERALYISCADSFMKDLPEGLSTVIGEKGIGLSEGQIQRIAIARAILSGAPILLLDEATSALDEATEARLLRHLKELQDKTCLIISHKMAALQICNKHMRIENQKIVIEQSESKE